TPAAITAKRSAATLEDAFIAYLQDAIGEQSNTPSGEPPPVHAGKIADKPEHRERFFDLRRMFAYTRREALELQRDPIRATLAILGSVILM
ncbi:hypothetical protein, partial [Streptomyces caniscabiei]|uniref:hypothetical protein n=1 Tax=Streptomyces caniscabiei TaxID=2746961 RepID=UPI0038F71A8E